MRKFILTVLLTVLATPVFALGKLDGFAEVGGATVRAGGFKSSTKIQQSFPGAQITIYEQGTLTKAVLYADSSLTPLSNPVTADAKGYWLAYLADGCYDLTMAHADLAVPFTQSYKCINDGTTVSVVTCSGTNDDVAIQAAIDAVATRGSGAVSLASGEVVISAGECSVSNTIVINQQSVTIRGVGAGSVLVWAGAAGEPMFQVLDSTRVQFLDLSIIGNNATPPSAAIYFETPTIPIIGTQEFSSVERVMIGRRFVTDTNEGALQYGIRFGGAAVGNNDTWRIRDVQIFDCSVAGIAIDNEQAIWGVIENTLINSSAIGIKAEGSFQGFNLTFNRNTVADIDINDGTAVIFGYWSEHAEKLWNQQTAASLFIYGGRALLSDEMIGNPSYAVSAVTAKQTLTLMNLSVLDASATSAKLSITGSSSNTDAAWVYMRGNMLPNGDSDTGYDVDGYAAGTPLHVDIQQGSYTFRKVVQSLNATGGEWVTPTYSAGDFTASGTMAWGVDAGDRLTHMYRRHGKTMKVIFNINATDVTAPLSNTLRIAIPTGATASKSAYGLLHYVDAGGTPTLGICRVVASGTTIDCMKADMATNWTATAGDNTSLRGEIEFEIN